jgi:hypothetical protein
VSSDYFLEKVVLETALPGNVVNANQKSGTIVVDYQITRVNEKQEINHPSQFTTIEHPAHLTQTVTGVSSTDINLLTELTKSVGANFLTIERLVKVLFLLPASLKL